MPTFAPRHADGRLLFRGSMTVEETNRVRAMLGLKPLNVGGAGKPTQEQVRETARPPVIRFIAKNLNLLAVLSIIRAKYSLWMMAYI